MKKLLKNKLLKTRNIMLLVSMIMIIVYTGGSMLISYLTDHDVNATLTKCWYTYWGSTVFTNAGITIVKTLKGQTNSDDDE